MRVSILDRNANLLSFSGEWINAKDVFWIECSLREVYNSIFPYLPDDRLYLKLIDNPEDCDDKFYYWISKDLTVIEQYFRVFPHSGMNDMKRRYLHSRPIEISSLEELKYLDIERFENV